MGKATDFTSYGTVWGILLVGVGSINLEQSILWPIFGFSFTLKDIVRLGFRS